MISNIEVVVMGASAGGIAAVKSIILNINNALPHPLVIVQHIPKNYPDDLGHVYEQILNFKKSNVNVRKVEDKMPLEENTIYFAPPDYHLLIEKEKTFSLSQDECVQFSRPSIDVLFESASRSLKSKVLGILLTGANNDGAQGLRSIQEAGGFTIVQDPLTAEMDIMPRAALDIMTPNKVLNLEDIAKYLNTLKKDAVYA